MAGVRSKVEHFFSNVIHGNPFDTHIGNLVDAATREKMSTEDWPLFMRICDAVVASADGPRDAIRAIRRKFDDLVTVDVTRAHITLSLLESCVKNCGYAFHHMLGKKEILDGFARYCYPANNVPIALQLQEKLLKLISCWAMAFEQFAELQEFGHIYRDLKERNVIFPKENNADSMLISTMPVASRGVSAGNPASQKQLYQTSKVVHPPAPTPRTKLSPAERREKLSHHRQQIDSNLTLLSDFLDRAQSKESSEIDVETKSLMAELNYNSREAQKWLAATISRWEGMLADKSNSEGGMDSLFLELLATNDRMNEVLERYKTLGSDFSSHTQVNTVSPLNSVSPSAPQNTTPAANTTIAQPIAAREEGRMKIANDLKQVEANVAALTSLMIEAQGKRKHEVGADQITLMENVVEAIKEMQKRLTETIANWETSQLGGSSSSGDMDNLFLDMLSMNDRANEALTNYWRLQISFSADTQPLPATAASPNTTHLNPDPVHQLPTASELLNSFQSPEEDQDAQLTVDRPLPHQSD